MHFFKQLTTRSFSLVLLCEIVQYAHAVPSPAPSRGAPFAKTICLLLWLAPGASHQEWCARSSPSSARRTRSSSWRKVSPRTETAWTPRGFRASGQDREWLAEHHSSILESLAVFFCGDIYPSGELAVGAPRYRGRKSRHGSPSSSRILKM